MKKNFNQLLIIMLLILTSCSNSLTYKPPPAPIKIGKTNRWVNDSMYVVNFKGDTMYLKVRKSNSIRIIYNNR